MLWTLAQEKLFGLLFTLSLTFMFEVEDVIHYLEVLSCFVHLTQDLENLDPNDIMVKKLQQMEKERREKETKYKTQEKRIDHMERAKREVELPLLEQYYQQQKEKDRQLHEKREEERVRRSHSACHCEESVTQWWL